MRHVILGCLAAALLLGGVPGSGAAQAVRVDLGVRTGGVEARLQYGPPLYYRAGGIVAYRPEGRDGERWWAWQEHQREYRHDRREHEREYWNDVREAEREWAKQQRELEREYQKDLREAEREWAKDRREAEREAWQREREQEREYLQRLRESARERGGRR
jgi:hypothetical protein